MSHPQRRTPSKWVLAYEKDGYLVDYLRHPEFIFDNIELAAERKSDAYVLLHRVIPYLKPADIRVAPLRDFY